MKNKMFLLIVFLLIFVTALSWDMAEKFDEESDVDNTILGLGTLFSLLFLYTLKKGGGDDNPGRKAPIKL
ncbi:MAG: hypothetical protein KAS66_16145 [Candidatus Omnitrophica bacterium]|nr:hypothetical protein [Candidatus Omnitrophota bacterium]